MKRKKIYLSGHIKELDYRRVCKEKYSDKFIFIDPVNFIVEEMIEGLTIEEASDNIVKFDKAAILLCDIFVAWIEKPTFGTIMEIIFAFDHGIPVYIINENKQFMKDFWLYYHCNELFNSIDSCFEYLISNGI